MLIIRKLDVDAILKKTTQIITYAANIKILELSFQRAKKETNLDKEEKKE